MKKNTSKKITDLANNQKPVEKPVFELSKDESSALNKFLKKKNKDMLSIIGTVGGLNKTDGGNAFLEINFTTSKDGWTQAAALDIFCRGAYVDIADSLIEGQNVKAMFKESPKENDDRLFCEGIIYKHIEDSKHTQMGETKPGDGDIDPKKIKNTSAVAATA